MANKAKALKTGARGLRSILEDVMLDIMFDIPDDKTIEKVIINEKCVSEKLPPVIVRKKASEQKKPDAAKNQLKVRLDTEVS